MAPQKPTTYALWNPTQSSVVQPPDTLRARGYQANEAPIASHVNWMFWLTDQWVQYFDNSLSSAVMTTTLDNSMRLIGGGTLSFALSTGTLTWSQPLTLAIPSLADSANNIAAGTLALQPGQVAYVQANVPFSTSGDVTSGQATVQNLAYEYGIQPGQTVTGPGIPSNTTVASVSGNQATLSNSATATGSQVTLTFSGVGALTLQAANSASLVPSPNTVIIARATATAVYLGVNTGQIILRDGETRRLLEAGYHDVRYLPAGAALAANTPVFVAGTGTLTAGAAYPCDASAGQGAVKSVCVGFAATQAASGATASIVTGGVLSGFSGLTQGAIYYLDPANVGGITATRPSSPAYAVSVGLALDTKSLYVRVASASGAPVLDPSYNSVSLAPVSGDTNAVSLALKDASGNSKFAVDGSGNVTAPAATFSIGAANVSGTATANSFVSAVGFKTQLVSMVYQGNVSAGQSLGSSSIPLNLLETTLQQIYTNKMPFAGSFLGMSVNFRYTATQSTAPTIYILPTLNGNTTLALNPNFTGGQNGNADYAFSASQARGINKFVVNDGLGGQFYTSVFPSAATFYLRVSLWVELLS